MKRKLLTIMIIILMLLCAFLISAQAEDGISDYDMFYYNGHTYQYSGSAATFQNASDICQSKGGHLAVVTSAEENHAIADYMRSIGATSAMIGLYDAAGSNGTWATWVTGEPVVYSNWGYNQPDWANQTICSIEINASTTYGWNEEQWDNGYNGDYHYICEWDYDLRKADISEATVIIKKYPKKQFYPYTGKEIKPKVTVKLGKITLKESTDYTLTYQNNKKAGDATVVVTGIGLYTGTVKATFKIRYDLSKAEIILKKNVCVYHPGQKFVYPKIKSVILDIGGGKKIKLKKSEYSLKTPNSTHSKPKNKIVIVGDGKKSLGTASVTFQIITR